MPDLRYSVKLFNIEIQIKIPFKNKIKFYINMVLLYQIPRADY